MTRYLAALWLLAAVTASPAVGQTLTLYEEGKPVSDGASLSVEVPCGPFGWEPPAWMFGAKMTANDATPVVVSIEPPRMARCVYNSLHGASSEAEVKEIDLSASGTTVVVSAFRRERWSAKYGHCEAEYGDATGRPPRNKHQANLMVRARGKLGERCHGKTARATFEVILRGSNGKVLEARYS